MLTHSSIQSLVENLLLSKLGKAHDNYRNRDRKVTRQDYAAASEAGTDLAQSDAVADDSDSSSSDDQNPLALSIPKGPSNITTAETTLGMEQIHGVQGSSLNVFPALEEQHTSNNNDYFIPKPTLSITSEPHAQESPRKRKRGDSGASSSAEQSAQDRSAEVELPAQPVSRLIYYGSTICGTRLTASSDHRAVHLPD